MAGERFETVEAYLEALPAGTRPVLEQVRAILRDALPDAEECVSYQIPALKIRGRPGLYFAGYAGHVGVYPASDALCAAVGAELAPYRVAKATLRFPLDAPVPDRLLRAVAAARRAEVVAEVEARQAARALKRAAGRAADRPRG